MRIACSTPASSIASDAASTMFAGEAGVAVGEETGSVGVAEGEAAARDEGIGFRL
jgi:hypothetical protein